MATKKKSYSKQFKIDAVKLVAVGAGTNATGYGSGGGGATSTQFGGASTAGVVIVEWVQ